jgi:hypothetical protein
MEESQRIEKTQREVGRYMDNTVGRFVLLLLECGFHRVIATKISRLVVLTKSLRSNDDDGERIETCDYD